MSVCLGRGKVIRLRVISVDGWEWERDFQEEMERWRREMWLWIEEREISSKREYWTRMASSFVLFCWWERLVLLSPKGPAWTFPTTEHLKENKMFLQLCKFIISRWSKMGLFYFIFCSGIKIACFSCNLWRCRTDDVLQEQINLGSYTRFLIWPNFSKTKVKLNFNFKCAFFLFGACTKHLMWQLLPSPSLGGIKGKGLGVAEPNYDSSKIITSTKDSPLSVDYPSEELVSC